jgi:signal transduction histidine kinase
MQNVSKKIAYAELMITSIVLITLIPYIIVNMGYSPLQLFHYVNITMFILAPLGFMSLFYFLDRWECRPIEMLSFYLERGIRPPDDVLATARVRALNLPLVHSISILVRYQFLTVADCLYMGFVGDLPLRENIRLGIYAAAGLAIFPIFSFFLTERILYPVRQMLAEKTINIRIDDSRVIKINTRTRVLSILLATVIAPLAALGEIAYRRVAREFGDVLGIISPLEGLLRDLSGLIILMIFIAVVISAGIGILLATSISHPLGHMVNVIRELERGNLKARSHLIANDEMGVLSQSFDKMAQEFEKNRDSLEDLNRNLELRVAEKTENLTKAYERLQRSNQNLAVANRELEEANKKLKELDRLKSDFISIVSHELRTPLTSIKAFAELILMKPGMAAEKQTRLIGIINAESDRLARLISEILDLTKIEAGKLTWHIGQVSIEEIIGRALDGIQALADNKSLVVTTDIVRGLPSIFGDRDRLLQVVTNILSNAIKFTPQGGSIAIRAYQNSDQRPQLVVEVSDTGVGIPDNDLDLIFEKFHRTGDLLSGKIEGTGLGLAITRQIVEYHGGKIWATSNLGYGSTFSFTLPLDKVGNIETDQQTSAALL